MSSIVDAITRHNAGRERARLAMKYARMAQDPFIFLRGACHLYYDALPDALRDAPALAKAPLAWCCGDLHFENVGSYKGDNRLVYFDINDFDEAALAPATWDIVRLLTSIQCGAGILNATRAEALAASRACLDGYRSALIAGKPLWMERETSTGLVKALLSGLEDSQRAAFLDRRTLRSGGKRMLKVNYEKALPASAAHKARISQFMARFAAKEPDPQFYRVLDVARRIAGTGSLGLARFVVLVEGKGSPDGNYLLDLKEALPSALEPALARLRVAQPAWPHAASRVVTIQDRMQSVDHAFLRAVKLGHMSCILKELQPTANRVDLARCKGRPDLLLGVVTAMGRILAWDQLRAAGRDGAAAAGALIDFAAGRQWPRELLDASRAMTRLTQQQWKTFAEAWRDGALTRYA